MRVLFKFLIVFIALFALAATSVFAQKTLDEPYIVESSSSGEIASQQIDHLRSELRQNDEHLFIISRRGKNERFTVSFLRLDSTKRYFEAREFDLQKITFAVGEVVEGKGRIEFYLGSRLRLVLLAPKNGMPKLTCCDDYMPPMKNKIKRKNRKIKK